MLRFWHRSRLARTVPAGPGKLDNEGAEDGPARIWPTRASRRAASMSSPPHHGLWRPVPGWHFSRERRQAADLGVLVVIAFLRRERVPAGTVMQLLEATPLTLTCRPTSCPAEPSARAALTGSGRLVAGFAEGGG